MLQWLGPKINETFPVTLPNPYHIPDSPYNITFQPPTEFFDEADDAINCLVSARQKVVQHIEQFGNGPIPHSPNYFEFRYQRVVFHIESVAARPMLPQISYSDTAVIIAAFLLKMTRDGFQERSADIIMVDGGERVGVVLLVQFDNEVKEVQLPTIPNPYPLPDTPFSLNFRDIPDRGARLPRADVDRSITIARQEILQHIQRHGNGKMSGRRFRNGDIDLSLGLDWRGTDFTYQDFLATLLVFSLKMSREGYYERYADIIYTDGRDDFGYVKISSGDLPPSIQAKPNASQ
ncbi:MAG: hypothetical protein Q9185_000931 [Variospora sp. 1 TL-2023]